MSDLEKMNLKQLRERARALEIPNRSKLRKAELILALLAAKRPTTGPERSKSRAPLPTSGQHQGSSSSSSTAGGATSAPSMGPDGDPGLPIPESYGRDVVVLMVQDPHHLYAWWELSGGITERLMQQLDGSATAVLVLTGPGGIEQREIDLAAGNYYLSVGPNETYQVSLALRDGSGRLHLLAESQSVRTPPASTSDALDEEWMAVDETFAELMARAEAGGEQLSSAERLRAQRLWHNSPVHPWFSGHLGSSALSSAALSSSALSSAQLQGLPSGQRDA